MTTRINCSYVLRWRKFPSDRSTHSHHYIYSWTSNSYQKLYFLCFFDIITNKTRQVFLLQSLTMFFLKQWQIITIKLDLKISRCTYSWKQIYYIQRLTKIGSHFSYYFLFHYIYRVIQFKNKGSKLISLINAFCLERGIVLKCWCWWIEQMH